MADVIVFGTGFGCLTHVRTLRQAGFDVRAIVGQNPERTAERARRFDVPVALTSIDIALAMEGVDAVAIATPPATHHALVLAAAAAGKHVLCEKPFAANAQQAEAMCDAVERAGVIHLLGTEFRYSPGNALLARVVQSGRIGDPIDAQFALDVPFVASDDAEVPAWWRDNRQAGGWLGAWGFESGVLNRADISGRFLGFACHCALQSLCQFLYIPVYLEFTQACITQ